MKQMLAVYHREESVVHCLEERDKWSSLFLGAGTCLLLVQEQGWHFSKKQSGTLAALGNRQSDAMKIEGTGVWEYVDERGQKYALVGWSKEDRVTAYEWYVGESCITIGTGRENTIVYDCMGLVSRIHAVITYEQGQWWVKDTSTNGVYLQGKRVRGKQSIACGEEVSFYGLQLLFLEHTIGLQYPYGERPICHLEAYSEKQSFLEKGATQAPVLWKKQSLEPMPPIADYTVDLTGMEKEPAATVINIGEIAISFCGKRARHKKKQQLQRYLTEKSNAIEETRKKVLIAAQNWYPSASERLEQLSQTACVRRGKNPGLWIRLGEKTTPTTVQYILPYEHSWEYAQAQELIRQYKELEGMPAGIDFGEKAIWAAETDPGYRAAVVRAVLVQLLLVFSEEQIRLAVLYASKQDEEWVKLLRFLPQLQGKQGERLLFGNVDVGSMRWKKCGEEAEEDVRHTFVLAINGQDWLGQMDWKEMKKISAQGGYSFLFFVDNSQGLPDFCGQLKDPGFHFDTVSEQQWQWFVRNLTAFSYEHAVGKRQRAELVELQWLVREIRTQQSILQNWKKNRCTDAIAARIGCRENGDVFSVDLHETKQGPHGVIVGTTGAGKSELLQTVLLSYATAYSPLELQFLLVDYKGGGMMKGLQGLPHIAGCLTNFDDREATRGLQAIFSENRRRQELFSLSGVKQIDEYQRKMGSDHGMPHLCIIVDEFAELKREKKEFLDGLLQIARTGRSLGIHLLLATQRAVGVVDESILANSNLRICMRMQDEGECEALLHEKKNLSGLPAGRGFAAWGDRKLVEFQAAWGGAEKRENGFCCEMLGADGLSMGETDTKSIAHPEGRAIQKSGRAVVNAEKGLETGQKQTQQEWLFRLILHAAETQGIAGIKKLWLPMLPSRVSLSKLEKRAEGNVVLGLCDVPQRQKQIVYTYELEQQGNLLIAGPSQSGKSKLVSMLLLQMLAQYDSSELWIYIFDFDQENYGELEGLSQVGGIAENAEMAEKYLYLLQKEQQGRRKVTGKKKAAKVLLVIDNVAGFRSQTEDRYTDFIYGILRDGAKEGWYVWATAGGMGRQELPFSWKKQFSEKVLLCPDDGLVMELFESAEKPADFACISGRGLVQWEQLLVQIQTVVCSEDPAGEEKAWDSRLELMKKQGVSEEKGQARRLYQIPDSYGLQQFIRERALSGEERKEQIIGRRELDGSFYRIYGGEACFAIVGKREQERWNICESMLQSLQVENSVCVILGTGQGEAQHAIEEMAGANLNLQYCKTIAEGRRALDQVKSYCQKQPVWMVVEDSKAWVQMEREADDAFLEEAVNTLKGSKTQWILLCGVHDKRYFRYQESVYELLENACMIFVGAGAEEQTMLGSVQFHGEVLSRPGSVMVVDHIHRKPERVRIPLKEDENESICVIQ